MAMKWFRKYNKFLVKINYKSGNSHQCWFYTFEYTRSGSVASVEFKTVDQMILVMSIDEIESIFVVKSKVGRKVWSEP